jgi:hypothetical protein
MHKIFSENIMQSIPEKESFLHWRASKHPKVPLIPGDKMRKASKIFSYCHTAKKF